MPSRLSPTAVRVPADQADAWGGCNHDARRPFDRLSGSLAPVTPKQLLFGQGEPVELPPPRPLSLAARQVWDRNAERIWLEGRWDIIDRELLAVFSETLELYERFMDDVSVHGTLVQGRTLQEKVRNPSLMGLAQARADLARYARQIPLMPPPTAADAERDEIDRLLDGLDV